MIKRMLKVLLLLSCMVLAGCSIDFSGPTHKPPEPIYIMDTPASTDTTTSPAKPDPATALLPWAGSNLSGHLIYIYDLERVAFPGGQPQKLIDSAFWPRLSPDGSKMAYVSFVPKTNSNDLYLANADSSQAKLVMPAGAFTAVDAPTFSPDSKTIVFSAVGEPQLPSLSWLDQLMGVQIAEAHNVPSDWWRVSVDGGKPERLTQINGTGMYADFAPDGQHVAFSSITGLYVMRPDGGNLIQLNNEGLGGSVSWTP